MPLKLTLANEQNFFSRVKTGEVCCYASNYGYGDVQRLAQSKGVQISYCAPETPEYAAYGDRTFRIEQAERLCHRSACRKPGATYFNLGNKQYYCPECANLINESGELCVLPTQRWKGYLYRDGVAETLHIQDLKANGAHVGHLEGSGVEFGQKALALFEKVAEVLKKAEVYGLRGETLHASVKCEIKGLTMGDVQSLQNLIEEVK